MQQSSAYVLKQASKFDEVWELPPKNAVTTKNKRLHFFFCGDRFWKDEWELKTSPFFRKIKKRERPLFSESKRPRSFCLFVVLWSHESNDLCCYSQSAPDFPPCRSPLITPSMASMWHIVSQRWILWCCYMSDAPVVIISLSLIQTQTHTNTHTQLPSTVNLGRWGKY